MIPQKIKTRPTIRPSNPALGINLKNAKAYLQRQVPPYAHGSIILGGRDLETAKEPCDGGSDKKRWHMYTVDYHSARRKGDMLPFATTGWTLRTSC